MTMIEVVIAMAILLIAVGGTLATISSVGVLTESSRERSVAFAGAQRALEQMQGEDFREVFARYNADAGDDVGPNPPGASFDVAGLDPQRDDPDAAVGQVLFPVDGAAPASLFENLDEPSFGLPRDLDADGALDAADHAGDYAVLPVRVRVEWRDRSGNHFVELATVLRER